MALIEPPEQEFFINKKTIYKERQPQWTLRDNPPPPRLSNLNSKDKLYVVVMDDEYKACPHQCIIKNQWINDFLSRPEVDGVEFYSVNAWDNQECNISSITIPSLPKQKIDPSAFLLLETFKLYLNRSDSDWLYIIGDAAYIRTPRFFEYVKRVTQTIHPDRDNYMVGSCVEERYFFQMLLLNSGVLFSRKLVNRFVDTADDRLWKVTFDVGITAEEIMAQISDKMGIHVPSKQNHEFLGRGWRKPEHYTMLLKKEFDSLPKCKIPHEYLRPAPGELGLCSAEIFRVDDMSVWAGTHGMSKEDFLNSAEKMLENLPSHLCYYWDRLQPTLCIR